MWLGTAHYSILLIQLLICNDKIGRWLERPFKIIIISNGKIRFDEERPWGTVALTKRYLYQKLALTFPTSGSQSVGIICLRTKSHGVCLFVCLFILLSGNFSKICFLSSNLIALPEDVHRRHSNLEVHFYTYLDMFTVIFRKWFFPCLSVTLVQAF
jgi:hypothetical protein